MMTTSQVVVLDVVDMAVDRIHEGTRETKVNEVDLVDVLTAADEKVVGLQIAVHVAKLVDELKAVQQLHGDYEINTSI